MIVDYSVGKKEIARMRSGGIEQLSLWLAYIVSRPKSLKQRQKHSLR